MTQPECRPASDGAVRVRRRHRSVRPDGMIVEIDPRLPGTTTGRTVYHSPGSDRYLSAPHQHGDPHVLLCLAGSALVGLHQAGQHRPAWSRLDQGDALTVPGWVPHRVWLAAGTILAAASPASSWLATSGMDWLPSGEGWTVP